MKLLKPESGNFLGSFNNIFFELLVYRISNFVFCFLFFQLAYCIVQFLEKDPSLTEPVSIFPIFSNYGSLFMEYI